MKRKSYFMGLDGYFFTGNELFRPQPITDRNFNASWVH